MNASGRECAYPGCTRAAAATPTGGRPSSYCDEPGHNRRTAFLARSQGVETPAGARRSLSGDVDLLRRTLASAIEALDELGDPAAVDAALRSAEARAAAQVAAAQSAAEMAAVEAVAARSERDGAVRDRDEARDAAAASPSQRSAPRRRRSGSGTELHPCGPRWRGRRA